MNEREDKLIKEAEEKFKNLFFDEDIILESDKLPNKVKKCLDNGKEIKDKWNKENELSYVINYCIEFENNINKIDEINQKINNCNSNKIKLEFDVKEKRFDNKIKKLGYIKGDYEEDKKSESYSKKSSVSRDSKQSKYSEDEKKSVNSYKSDDKENSKNSRSSSYSNKEKSRKDSDWT